MLPLGGLPLPLKGIRMDVSDDRGVLFLPGSHDGVRIHGQDPYCPGNSTEDVFIFQARCLEGANRPGEAVFPVRRKTLIGPECSMALP